MNGTVINIARRRTFSTTPNRQKTHYGIPSALPRPAYRPSAVQSAPARSSTIWSASGSAEPLGADRMCPRRDRRPSGPHPARTFRPRLVSSVANTVRAAAGRRIVIRFIVRCVNNERESERRQSLLRKSIHGGNTVSHGVQ